MTRQVDGRLNQLGEGQAPMPAVRLEQPGQRAGDSHRTGTHVEDLFGPRVPHGHRRELGIGLRGTVAQAGVLTKKSNTSRLPSG